MEILSIKLAQNLGYKIKLWSNQNVENIPDGVTLEDIPSWILPPTTFQGIPMTCIPNGGIGSLAHWADYFAFSLLKETGGCFMQLDFAMLKKIETKKTYISANWKNQFSPVFFRVPCNSSYAQEVSKILSSKIKNNYKNNHWESSMNIIHECAVRHKVYEDCLLIKEGYVGCGGNPKSKTLYNSPLKGSVSFVHWSNATHNSDKKLPIEGSFYWKLCKENKLI